MTGRAQAKLKADVARLIDGEAWKAMDDGRDALEGSLWHLRRDWALEKASQIIDLVTESRIRDLEERLAKAAEALEPFNTDWATEDGWTDYACQNDRVVDWFGPSDFRRAAEVFSQIRSEK